MTTTAQYIIDKLIERKGDLENKMSDSSPSEMGIVTWYSNEDRIEFLGYAIKEVQSIIDCTSRETQS